MSAFAALLKHAYKMSALELGDGKSDLSNLNPNPNPNPKP